MIAPLCSASRTARMVGLLAALCASAMNAGTAAAHRIPEIAGCRDFEGNHVLLVRSRIPRSTVLHIGVASDGERSARFEAATWHVPLALSAGQPAVVQVTELDGAAMLPPTTLSVSFDDDPELHTVSFDARAIALLDAPADAPRLPLDAAEGIVLVPITEVDLHMDPVDCPYSAVAVRVSRLAGLPHARLTWLDRFVFRGGHLFLVGDSAGEVPAIPSPFDSALPEAQSARVPAAELLEALTGMPFPAASAPFVRSLPGDARVRTAAPLTCQPHGFGQFTYVGMDALSESVLSWPGRAALWSSLYRSSMGRVLGYAGARQVAHWVLHESEREARESRGGGLRFRRVVSHPTVTFGLGILLLFGVLHFGACFLYRSGRVRAFRFLLLAWAGSVLVSALMLLAQHFRGAVPFTFRALEVRYLFPDRGRRIAVSGISIRSRFRATLTRRWQSVPERVRTRSGWSGMSSPVQRGDMLDLRLNAFERAVLSTFDASAESDGLTGEVVLDPSDWSVDVRLHGNLDEAILEGVLIMSRLSSDASRGTSVCAASLGPLSPESDLEFEGLPSWPVSEASARLREPTAHLAERHSRSVYYGSLSQGRPVCLYIGLLSTWTPNLLLESGDALRAGSGLIVQELPLRIREPRDPPPMRLELEPAQVESMTDNAGEAHGPAQLVVLVESGAGAPPPLWHDGVARPLSAGVSAELRFDVAWHVREPLSEDEWPDSVAADAPARSPGRSAPELVIRAFDLSSRSWRSVWRESYESLESLSTDALRRRVTDIRASLASSEGGARRGRAASSTPVAVGLPDVHSLISFPEPEVRLWVALEGWAPDKGISAAVSNVRLIVGDAGPETAREPPGD